MRQDRQTDKDNHSEEQWKQLNKNKIYEPHIKKEKGRDRIRTGHKRRRFTNEGLRYNFLIKERMINVLDLLIFVLVKLGIELG
jgi:hypothetical protein